MSLEKRCRVCAASQLHLENADFLFGPRASRKLRIYIRALFRFKVKSTDSSNVVCQECSHKINSYYEFYIKVKNAQKAFFSGAISSTSELNLNDTVTSNKNSDNEESNVFENCNIVKLEEITNVTNCETVQNDNLENRIKNETVDFECVASDLDFSDQCSDVNFSFQSDDNQTFSQECENDTERDTLSDKRNVKKHKLKRSKEKIKLKSRIKLEDDEVNVIKGCIDTSNFPTEIIRDGKLIIKGPLLDELIAKFYNLQCDMCHEYPKFKNLSKLKKHYEAEHKTKGYLTCCSARFYHHRSIYMHMARHLQPSAFECPICKKAVSRPHTLKLHLQTHLPDTEKPLKCDQCDKRFIYLDALTSHKMTHIPIEKRETLNCKICGKIFTLAASFSTHMRAVHSGIKYLCSECGRSFQRKTELTFHMLTHDTTGKNQVQCQHCGFICKNQPTLRIHLKKHSEERLQCSLCGYSTHRRQQLNMHMKVKHSDEKPFSCVVCDKQFKLKSVMMTHMAQHTGERKYACSFCPKTFASGGNYHSHRKREHAEEHQNDIIMKQRERFKKIESNEMKTGETDDSHIHEMAREYLKKFIDPNNKNSITS